MDPKKIAQAIIVILLLGSGYLFYTTVFGAATLSKTPENLERGLVGHWTFDGPDMLSNVADTSGNGNNGRLVNFTATTTVEGRIGQALSFDGVDDYVATGNDSSLAPAQFSVSLWAKSDVKELSALFRSAYGNGYNSGFAILQQSSGAAYLRWGDGVNLDGTIASSDTNATEWRHIVATYDGTTMKLYVNGVLEGSDSTVNFAYSNTAEQYIGVSSGVEEFNGVMDDVRLYNRALSASEVRQLYNGTKGSVLGKALSLKSSDPLKNGLVSHWTFDGSTISGTTVSDVGPAGNDGTLANNPKMTEGKVGQAIQLKGAGYNQSVYIPDSSSLFLGNNITIAAWVKRADTDDIHVIYSDYIAGETPDTEYNFEFLATTNWDKLRFYTNSGSTNENVYTTGTVGSYPLNEWIHVAVTWDGTNAKFYLNGELKDTRALAYTPVEKVGTDYRIGERRGGFGDFEGAIDDVRIYNRPLSDSEIALLYERTKGETVNKLRKRVNVLRLDLVGHWTFDGPDMLSNVADTSGNGNNGRLVGFAATTTVEGRIGQALSFDGVDDYVEIPTSATLSSGFVNTNERWSYSVWLKPRLSGSTNQELFMGVWHRPRVQIVLPGILEFDGFVGGVYTVLAKISNFFVADRWVHLVITSDGTTYRIYRNGVEVASASYQQVDSGASKYTLGAAGDGSNAYNGIMDDVRLYGRTLRPKEVKLLYLMGR